MSSRHDSEHKATLPAAMGVQLASGGEHSSRQYNMCNVSIKIATFVKVTLQQHGMPNPTQPIMAWRVTPVRYTLAR